MLAKLRNMLAALLPQAAEGTQAKLPPETELKSPLNPHKFPELRDQVTELVAEEKYSDATRLSVRIAIALNADQYWQYRTLPWTCCEKLADYQSKRNRVLAAFLYKAALAGCGAQDLSYADKGEGLQWQGQMTSLADKLQSVCPGEETPSSVDKLSVDPNTITYLSGLLRNDLM